MLKRIRRRLKRVRRDYQRLTAGLTPVDLHLGAALRGTFREGYGLADLRADVLAGLSVGIVALPLSMALAIAAGVPPQYGLYTAIVGGAVVALLGGSRMQVSGPTAAFVVILAPIMVKFGLSGLLTATLLAGFILVLLGLMQMGKLIQYVPDPVITGFTAGIAVVIATFQIKDFFGLDIGYRPEHYWDQWIAISTALPTARLAEAGVAVFTLVLLLLWPRIMPRIPAPLVALVAASALGAALAKLGGIQLHTIGTSFSYLAGGHTLPGIPQLAPAFMLPWMGRENELPLSFEILRTLVPPAFAIAILGAIESLLSATVADGMAGTSHDPDGELVALGIGNVVAPFFGGFACTGALARTATNIRAGARSPIAAVTHAIFVLGAVLVFAPLLSWLPMASFAALLLVVAWNMSDAKHFAHILRVAPKSDVTVMLTCFGLTVFFDMTIAVTAGIMLAALLFIRRMTEVSGAAFLDNTHPSIRQPLPAGVMLYDVNGPLFFGAANKAMSSLASIGKEAAVVILDVSKVPAIDVTGIVNLESTLDGLFARGIQVIVVGLQEQPERSLEKAGLIPGDELLHLAPTRLEAKTLARKLLMLEEA